MEGTLLDVSEGGMSLASSQDFEQGSLVKVEFAALGRTITTSAVVWHSRPVRYMGSPGFLFGMMIDEACPEYQLLLPRRGSSDAKSAVAGTIPSLEEAEAEARKRELAGSPSAAPTAPKVEVETPQSSPATEKAKANFKKSLEEGHQDTEGQSFRVRAKKRSQPRTKTLSLTADSEGAAREAASEALGADWEVLEVTRAA